MQLNTSSPTFSDASSGGGQSGGTSSGLGGIDLAGGMTPQMQQQMQVLQYLQFKIDRMMKPYEKYANENN
jgi:hypothetical protein